MESEREGSLIIGFLFCHIISSNTRSSAKRKNYFYYFDHVFHLSLLSTLQREWPTSRRVLHLIAHGVLDLEDWGLGG